MRAPWGERQRDRLLAVVVAAFAASYVTVARGIEDSLLSDAVGAGGVPQGVGIAMGLAAVALFAKSFVGSSDGGQNEAEPWLPILLHTGGLVLILLAYGALLPWLGYPLTICLLVGASGWLAGARPNLNLLLCAAVSGPALWAMFDQALQVRMPVGTLWGG